MSIFIDRALIQATAEYVSKGRIKVQQGKKQPNQSRAAWDESKHPRVGLGNPTGGQFATASSSAPQYKDLGKMKVGTQNGFLFASNLAGGSVAVTRKKAQRLIRSFAAEGFKQQNVLGWQCKWKKTGAQPIITARRGDYLIQWNGY